MTTPHERTEGWEAYQEVVNGVHGPYERKRTLRPIPRHGMSQTREYKKWSGMLTRCHNSKDHNYKWYGARGVTVCPSWRESFLNFWNDMKGTYFPGATIDRIDNSKGYSKENCRWATPQQQTNNRACMQLYTFKGKTLSMAEWDRELGFSKGTVRYRLKIRGWALRDALTRPCQFRHGSPTRDDRSDKQQTV